jgi:hypothetical protein
LEQNYPNPFNPSTTIEFHLPQTGFVTLEVYGVLGQTIATLVSSELNAGTYRIQWDARGLASGLYFYKVFVRNPPGQPGSFSSTKRMLLAK